MQDEYKPAPPAAQHQKSGDLTFQDCCPANDPLTRPITAAGADWLAGIKDRDVDACAWAEFARVARLAVASALDGDWETAGGRALWVWIELVMRYPDGGQNIADPLVQLAGSARTQLFAGQDAGIRSALALAKRLEQIASAFARDGFAEAGAHSATIHTLRTAPCPR